MHLLYLGEQKGVQPLNCIKMVVAMNKDAISIIQQQADTDDNADSEDDFYDDVIAQSALNWMEKD